MSLPRQMKIGGFILAVAGLRRSNGSSKERSKALIPAFPAGQSGTPGPSWQVYAVRL
jgi:hypothetical protein